mmetsp:Transcript_49255/g.96346  ORF Transcript_49255/g.96346 Transcript_49255/m.96346 type:complete len:205 (+) Transcript_49255:47-661(+)
MSIHRLRDISSEVFAPCCISASLMARANCNGVCVPLTLFLGFVYRRKRVVPTCAISAPAPTKNFTTLDIPRAATTTSGGRGAPTKPVCPSAAGTFGSAPYSSTSALTQRSTTPSTTNRARQHSTRRVPPILARWSTRSTGPNSRKTPRSLPSERGAVLSHAISERARTADSVRSRSDRCACATSSFAVVGRSRLDFRRRLRTAR